jgi:hypothetical protein
MPIFSGNIILFLICRAMGDVSERIGRLTNNGHVWPYLSSLNLCCLLKCFDAFPLI